MNQNSIVFFHINNYYCKNIFDICKNMNLHLFECQKIDILAYVMKKIEPRYVVIDGNNGFNNELFIDFINNNSNSFIYLITNQQFIYNNKHIFVVNSIEDLKIVLLNHYRCYNQFISLNTQENYVYYSLVSKKLKSLAFSFKHIGVKYLTEYIYKLFINNSLINKKCKDIFKELSIKYNKSISSIEKSIRFCIKEAYNNCKNKNTYYEISKKEKIPSIKEFTNYLADYVILSLNK